MELTAEAGALNKITGITIDCSMAVHTALGPGLLESAYQACLVHELRKRGVSVEAGVRVPVIYDGLNIDLGYRIDILVEQQVIVELKAVDRIHPIHQAQLLSYMKLQGRKVGLLINFNVVHLKDGITRLVHGL